MKKVLLAVCAVVLFAGASFAATPIKLSLWDRISLPQDDAVHGLELGIGSYTPELRGVAWNFIFTKTDDAVGWQAGLVTLSKDVVGLQSGLVNLNQGNVKGVQWGFVNQAKSVNGLQLGFVNIADSGSDFALQIGLVNFLGDSSIYKVFPFINLKL
ncbi:MAG: hypothetical protein FWG57_07780 [Endomicrobia bacterium]|nr:hypothetical protein [Endomicrobiia bacterium]